MPNHVEYSPDGKFIFATENDDTSRNQKLLWLDAQTKKELMSFSFNPVWGGEVSYSDDNSLVAINGLQIEIYRTENQQKILSADVSEFQTTDLKFSPDNRYLVYRTYDSIGHGPGSLQVWNLEKQKWAYIIPATETKTWEESYDPTQLPSVPNNPINPSSALSNIVIDPSSQFFAVGDGNNSIFVWNLATGKLLHQLKGHADWITSLNFSPDGRLLASGSDDGTVRLWNMPNGSLARVITGFLEGIDSVAFTPDGKQLNVQPYNHPAQVVDVKTGKSTTIEDEPIISIGDPDPYLASLLKQGYIYSYGQPSVSPDGKTLVLTNSNSFIVRWDIATKTVKDYWFVPSEGRLQDIDYNTQGQILALLKSGRDFSVWNTQTNQQIFPTKGWQKIKNTEDSVQNILLAPGGGFAAVSMYHHIEIWNLQQGNFVADLDLTTPTDYIDKIVFSQDSSQLYVLLSGDTDTMQVFDVKSGQQLNKIPFSHQYGATAIHWPLFAGTFSDENNQLRVDLWDLESNTLQTMQTAKSESYSYMCFTPDGSLLYLNTDPLKYFWKSDTAQLLYMSENFEFDCSATSPDSKLMLTSQQGKIDFWDIQALMQLAHSDSVTPIALPTPKTTNTPAPTTPHQPTLALTLVPTLVLSAGAIVPENVAQLDENIRFGQGNIEEIVWPADSTSILTVGSQGMYEYDAKTLIRTNLEESDTWLKGTVLTPDGRRIVVSQNVEKVWVRDLSNDKLLAEVTGQTPSISPDGKFLAYFNNGLINRLHLLDIETGQLTLNFSIYGEAKRAVFSSDSQLIAAIQSDSIRVWDVHTGQIINSLGGPNGQILSIAFSDDGKYITGAAGGTAWVWSLTPGATPTAVTLDPGHKYSGFLLFDLRVTSVTISSDDHLLAIGTSQNNILLYDVRNPTHVLRKLILQGDPANILRFGPDGKSLLSADQSGQLTLWDVQTGKALASQNEHVGPLAGMRFGDDDNLLTWSNHTLRIIHPQDATRLHSISIADGKIFAASPDALHFVSYLPYHISLWNAQTGKLDQTLQNEPDELSDWRYSDTRKDFTAATFSSDSKLFAFGGTSELFVYDLTGSLIGKSYGGYPYPHKIIFGPGNQQVASCSNYSCGVKIVNKNNFGIDLSECAFDFAFNPAGDLWAGLTSPCYDNVPSNAITIQQVATGDKVRTLQIPQASLTSMAFNADGRLLAVGQADGKILLIETESLKVLATLAGQNGSVDHLAFSNTGKWLASTAADGTITFWSIP